MHEGTNRSQLVGSANPYHLNLVRHRISRSTRWMDDQYPLSVLQGSLQAVGQSGVVITLLCDGLIRKTDDFALLAECTRSDYIIHREVVAKLLCSVPSLLGIGGGDCYVLVVSRLWVCYGIFLQVCQELLLSRHVWIASDIIIVSYPTFN